jgi:hypothetical protein
MADVIFEFKKATQCISHFGASSVFSGLGGTSRRRGEYLPTTSAYPSPELACIKRSLSDIHSLLRYSHYYIVQLYKFFNFDFPVMRTRAYTYTSKHCLIVHLLLFIGREIIIEQIDIGPFRIEVPGKAPLAHKDELGVVWDLLLQECLI